MSESKREKREKSRDIKERERESNRVEVAWSSRLKGRGGERQ